MAFLSSPCTSLHLALVLLNIDGASDLAHPTLSHLWSNAAVRLCADGAANRLHDALDERSRNTMLPDLIRGDLDSLRDDVAEFYQRSGVVIEHEPDQDTHDFEKCLKWLQSRQTGGRLPYSVVAFGAFGGRLDQMFANINMVYRFRCFERFFLLTKHSAAILLPAGRNVIEPNLEVESGSCGLLPLGCRCDGVITTGLKWNLDGNMPLEFGSLISSSNQIVSSQVTVETAMPLLWTTNFVKVDELALRRGLHM